MSDLFHRSVPSSYIAQVFDVMERADQHTFQVLTKRSTLMRNFVNARYATRKAPANIWLGVSIESPKLLVRLRTPIRIMRNDLKAESRRENSRFTIVPPAGAKKGTLGPGTIIRFPAPH